MITGSPLSMLQGVLVGTGGVRSAAGEIDRDALVAAVVASLNNRRLTLFVGAGLSYQAGLPTWNTLLARLSLRTIRSEHRAAFDLLSRFDSPLVVARYMKSQMRVREAFHREVHAALYDEQVDYERSNPTLDLVLAIVQRVAASGTTLDIVTYNFDDLLETEIARRCPHVSVTSVADRQSYHCSSANVRVLHVHGLLPRQSLPPVLPPPPLVLSEDEFHRLMNDPNAWQNRAQSDALAWRDCLFLGLSLTDPNLRRLVDYATPTDKNCQSARWIVARRYHVGDSIAPGEPPLDASTAEALNTIKAGVYSDLSAQVHYMDSFEEFNVMATDISVSAS